MGTTQNLIDIEKIFDIFEANDKNTAEEKLISQWYNNVAFFTKMVNQAHLYPKTLGILQEVFSNIDDAGELEFLGTLLIINRAFQRIQDMPLEDLSLKELVISTNTKEAYYKALKTSIKYFEEVEEYEKCAVLVKHLNFFYTNR
jgi:hypothetical protein